MRLTILKSLRHTLLESGPACVQLIYALRTIMWGIQLLFGVLVPNPTLSFLSQGTWPFCFLILGFLGLASLLVDSFWASFSFAALNVFLYGYLGFTHVASGQYMDATNFLFETLVVCWLTFRIPYDKRFLR